METIFWHVHKEMLLNVALTGGLLSSNDKYFLSFQIQNEAFLSLSASKATSKERVMLRGEINEQWKVVNDKSKWGMLRTVKEGR
jgi:hypothetical protein